MHPPSSQQVTGKPAPPSWLALGWALGRVLLVLALAFAFRHPILNAIEAAVDIVGVTEFAIDRIGTPATRLILAVSACFGFWILATACGRLFPRIAHPLSVALAAAFVAPLAWKTGAGVLPVIAVAVLLATNWAPLRSLARIGLGGTTLDRWIAIPPGVAEVFLSGRYLDWLGALLKRNKQPPRAEMPRILPGALIAALALAMLIPGTKLARYERALRSGPDVRMFATGDYNDIAFDARENRLLVTGHGVARVLGFDVTHLDARPLKANVVTGNAQSFEFDPDAREIFIYNCETHAILVLDSHTLGLKRTIPAPGISPGDPWIKQCPRSNTLTIASEADEQEGDPFVVFDRNSGAVLDRLDLEAGNLLLHPEKPILYANFFRRACGVVAYDLEKRKIVARASGDERTDRMALDPSRRELLMASPSEGRILAYDAETLAPKGAFKAIAGVRVMAVDAARGEMLVASLITGRVALMGLADRKVKHVWYLGPWLRSIVIAPGTGIAYVSSQKSLYELRYADRR